MSSAEAINIIPAKQWSVNLPGGAIALCEPFGGRPLTGGDFSLYPDAPPVQFTLNAELAEGYEFWREHTDVPVGVLLTDPYSPRSLSAQEEYHQLVQGHEVIGVAHTRSVYRHLRQAEVGLAAGDAALNGIEPHPNYIQTLKEAEGFDFTFDPVLGRGAPIPGITRALLKMREMVESVMRPWRAIYSTENPEPPADWWHAPDMVYCNTLQWAQLGLAGLYLADICGEQFEGEPPESILLIIPAEQSDLIGKLEVSGMKAIKAYVAYPEMLQEKDYQAYGRVLETGMITP